MKEKKTSYEQWKTDIGIGAWIGCGMMLFGLFLILALIVFVLLILCI